jgi:hypothetical protein
LPAGEIGRVVDVGEGLARGNRDPKKRAQWLPALFHVEDEEPLWGNRSVGVGVTSKWRCFRTDVQSTVKVWAIARRTGFLPGARNLPAGPEQASRG